MLLNNKEYVLSKRKAKDVLDLAKESKEYDYPKEGEPVTEEQLNHLLVLMAQVISDSLKATYMNLPLWRKVFNLKYRKFLKGAASLLIINLPEDELTTYYLEVLELEGGKKKVVPAEK